ncbi:MAG: cytochrome c [Saprospiraceae bacterium]|nr:cytochrome c [Pyrinomonadaceae bacterium]
MALSSCFDSKPKAYVIEDSKSYESSLFRQNCAICHGPEGNGKTLDDGRIVPSLRTGEFKFKTEDDIYRQIADGGNGMLPFRNQLTERELRLLAALVYKDLRKANTKIVE